MLCAQNFRLRKSFKRLLLICYERLEGRILSVLFSKSNYFAYELIYFVNSIKIKTVKYLSVSERCRVTLSLTIVYNEIKRKTARKIFLNEIRKRAVTILYLAMREDTIYHVIIRYQRIRCDLKYFLTDMKKDKRKK